MNDGSEDPAKPTTGAGVPQTISPGGSSTTSSPILNLRGRAVGGSIVTALSQGARFAIQLGGTIVLARLLDPSIFGLIAMAMPIIGLAFIFSEAGLSAATIQAKTISRHQISTLFWCNVAAGGVLTALLLLASPLFGMFYGTAEVVPVAAALSASVLISALGVQHQAMLRRELRLGSIAIQHIAGQLLGTLIGIASAVAGAGVWALVIMQLVNTSTQVLLAWHQSPFVPGRPSWDDDTKPLVGFGTKLASSNILYYSARHADNVMIGAYWGSSALGLYSKAYGLLLFPLQQFLRPLSLVAIPALSRLQDDHVRYTRAYGQMLRLVMLAAVPAGLFLILLPDAIVSVVLGPGWEGAIPIVAWLGLFAVVQPISQTSSWLFVSQGRAGDQLRWSIFSTGLTLVAFAAALPFGVVAMAASYSIAGTLIGLPTVLWLMTRRGPVRMRDLAAPAGLGAANGGAVAAAILLIRELEAPPLLLLVAAGAAASAVSLVTGLLSQPVRTLVQNELRDRLRSRGL